MTAAVAWLLLGLILAASNVHAQEAFNSHHTYTFGQTATFQLETTTTATEAQLFIKVDSELTQSYTVPLTDGKAHQQRDLRASPFPPFSQITYWWVVDEQETARNTFNYADNRFQWQILEVNDLKVYWVAGDASLMVNVLDIAQTTQEKIHSTLQAPTPEALSLYVYPSLPDLQSALRLTGKDWVAGQAYPEIGVILLAIAPSDEAILKMKRDIPHEITHKMHYDLVGPQGYATQPTWLKEGFAAYFEQIPDPFYAILLEEAHTQGQIIPLETLCYPFPETRERAQLAYAQSQSMITYLQRTYGWTRIRELVRNYADGLDCAAGIEQSLGVDINTLERDWRGWLERDKQSASNGAQIWTAITILARDIAPWLGLLFITLLPNAIFLILSKLRG